MSHKEKPDSSIADVSAKLLFWKIWNLGKCSHRYMACSKQILESTQWNPQFLSSSSTQATHNIESLCLKNTHPPQTNKLYHLKTDRWRSPLPIFIVLVYHGPPWEWRHLGSGAGHLLSLREFSSSCSCATCAACCCKADGFGAGSTMSTCGNAKALYLLQKMVDDRRNFGNIYIYICICICVNIYIIKGFIIYLGICIYEYKYRYIYLLYILYIYIYILYHVENFWTMYIYIYIII